MTLLSECGHEVIAGTGTLADPVIVKACTAAAGHDGPHFDRDLVHIDDVSEAWTCPPTCDGRWGHAHNLDGAP